MKHVASQLAAGATLEEICENMIRRCLQLGSRDNMSVMIVRAADPSKVCADAIYE